MKGLLKTAQAMGETLVADRRYLHGIPEVGHELPQTTAYVKKRLAEMGYDPKDVGNSGIVALVGGKKGGDRVMLLRADMDALPLKEESGLPFASVNGNCHACGHDIHTAMLLGAAQLLKDMEDDLPGTVKLMFQPAEETFTGARSMLEAGVLENPKVGAAFGIHTGPHLPLGTFGSNPACSHASTDLFDITIQGKGAHGAMPHNGVDPINVAAHIHIALQELLAREVNAQDTLVVSVGQLIAGQAANIIPDTAMMKGTIRAYTPAVRNLAVRRVQEIAEYTSKAFNATARVDISGGIPPLSQNAAMVALLLDLLQSSGLENPGFVEHKTMGSEDFSFIASAVPAAFLCLGCAPTDESKRFALHNPRIVFNEDCLPIGAAIHTAMAKYWLAGK